MLFFSFLFPSRQYEAVVIMNATGISSGGLKASGEETATNKTRRRQLSSLALIVFIVISVVILILVVLYVFFSLIMEKSCMFVPQMAPTITNSLDQEILEKTVEVPGGFLYRHHPQFNTNENQNIIVSKRAILVFHGNGGCAKSSIISFARLLFFSNQRQQQQASMDENAERASDNVGVDNSNKKNRKVVIHDLYVCEYPGYGTRSSEKIYNQDYFLLQTQAFLDFIVSEDNEEIAGVYDSGIVIVGTSLGSGVATYILNHCSAAAKEQVKHVVLVTPYSSIRDAADERTFGVLGWASSWQKLDNVYNMKWMKHQEQKKGRALTKRTLVIAQKDEMFPSAKHASKLSPWADETYFLKNTDHHNWLTMELSPFWCSLLLK